MSSDSDIFEIYEIALTKKEHDILNQALDISLDEINFKASFKSVDKNLLKKLSTNFSMLKNAIQLQVEKQKNERKKSKSKNNKSAFLVDKFVPGSPVKKLL